MNTNQEIANLRAAVIAMPQLFTAMFASLMLELIRSGSIKPETAAGFFERASSRVAHLALAEHGEEGADLIGLPWTQLAVTLDDLGKAAKEG